METKPILTAFKMAGHVTGGMRLLLAAAGISCAVNAFAATEPADYADQINHASVLYQPLMWIGSTPPSRVENEVLYTEVENMKKQGVTSGVPDLEHFIEKYPNSPWTPSLQANLGRYYFEHGQYTKAIQIWQQAWLATKDAKDGPAKRVADFTFAYWTRLLASLGRVDTLKSLYEETQGRVFDSGSLEQLVDGAKEGYHMMLTDPGVCFKCGTLALNNVGRSLMGASFDSLKIIELPSPKTGFNMTKLSDLAQETGLELVCADWGSGHELVVPSVVHWKENHYVAILQEKNGHYLVADPTFGNSRWLSASEIEEEASGHFMVPKDKLPKSWRLLTKDETDKIYGRGYVYAAPDSCDGCGNGSGGSSGNSSGSGGGGGGGFSIKKCRSCGAGGGGGSGASGGTGGNGDSCSTCPSGMAVWEVSEPCINVWIYDEPLGYQPAIGPRISFKLAYKQRESRTISPNFFSFGSMWDCSWLSYIRDDYPGYSATMEVAGGGERNYYSDNTTLEYFSQTRLERTTDEAGNLTGFIVHYANGAKDNYGFVPSENLDATQVAFLTSKMDPYGHKTQFVYQDSGGTTILKYIIDTDGRTNALSYTNAYFPSQITGVQDPFGRSATFIYDDAGMLTNITDVIGINSSFQYDQQGWITNLTTPYGTTRFQNSTNSFNSYDEFWGYDQYQYVRAARVIDSMNGTNVYMLQQNSSLVYDGGNYASFLPYSYDVSVVPQGVPTPTLDNTYLYYRDSFHWGPRQAANLPSDLSAFAPTDYLNGRMRHWLHNNVDFNLSQTLDMEQTPSLDGVSPGQTTWYDYDNKPATYEEGSSPNPSLIARVLPDGTTWYEWHQHDEYGNTTNVVETFSSGYGATPAARTNIYVYDPSGVNVVKQIGPLGEVTGYAYDANNNLLFMTNALNEVTAYTYDGQGRLTSIRAPSGLITTNIYFASGLYTNYIQSSIAVGYYTNSYTYTNDLVYLHVDERGLATTNFWDNLNRLVKVTYPDGTYVTNSYHWLDLVKTTDRMGFVNSFGYDNIRRKVAFTNALNNYTHYNYCACGALESVEDAAGNITSYSYDNAGNLLNVAYPDGYTIYYHLDLMGRVTNSVDSGGASITNWYDNQGLLYATTNSAGNVSTIAYNADYLATNSIDANNVSVAMTYDNLHRLRTRSYPDGGVEKYGYTPNYSGPTTYTNQIGNIVLYGYDTLNRKTNEVYVGVSTNKFAYNGAGDLLALTDGKNQVTSWGYDFYGRVTNKVDAASNLLFVYKYDPDNRLTNRWSVAKGGTTYRYDAVGNLTNVNYPVSPGIALKYDVLNRLTNMVDAVGITIYGYDAAGQLLSEDGPWASDTVSYTYANRLRKGLSVFAPNASAWVQGYGYDLSRRLTNVVSTAGSFGYAYDPVRLQRVKKLSLSNLAYITNTFDNVARLTGTYLKNSGNTDLDSYAYTYNQANQRTNVVRTAGDYVDYTYDNMGELTSAIAKESGGAIRSDERLYYAYDAAGNLIQKKTTPAAASQSVYGINVLNQITNTLFGDISPLTGWSGTLPVSGSTTSPATNVTVNGNSASLYADNTFSQNFSVTNGLNTFIAIAMDAYGRRDTNVSTVNVLRTNNAYAYDLNGNLLYDGRRAFAYDDENQLIRVTVTNAWKSEFTYDGKLRRRIAKEFSWNGSSWTQTNEVRYVYDGNLVVQERDANNLPAVTYTRGNDLSGTLQEAGGIGGLLARTDNSKQLLSDSLATAFYHADGNGNISALIYTNQMLAAKYLYDPFGNTLAQYGSLADANTYRFSSKEWNQNSGLYYYLYRFYDPNLQRWLNRDPIKFLTGKEFNLFLFVNNNAQEFVDPDGRAPITIPTSIPPNDPVTDPDEPNKIWNKLKDDVKDIIKTYLIGKTLPDAKKACDRIKCMDHNDANYAIVCQECAVFQCAKKLPLTALAMKNCLTAKFGKCDSGEDP